MPKSSENCLRAQDQIEIYLDGELDDKEREAFETHVNACATCREELSLAMTVVHGLRDLPQKSCPPHVFDAAAATTRAGAGETPFRRVLGWIAGRKVPAFGPAFRPAMAAMVVVIVAASVFVLSRYEPSLFSDAPVVTETYTEKELEMAKLDAMTALAYLGKYSQRTGEIIKHNVINERVMAPVQKNIVKPVHLFPLDA